MKNEKEITKENFDTNLIVKEVLGTSKIHFFISALLNVIKARKVKGNYSDDDKHPIYAMTDIEIKLKRKLINIPKGEIPYMGFEQIENEIRNFEESNTKENYKIIIALSIIEIIKKEKIDGYIKLNKLLNQIQNEIKVFYIYKLSEKNKYILSQLQQYVIVEGNKNINIESKQQCIDAIKNGHKIEKRFFVHK